MLEGLYIVADSGLPEAIQQGLHLPPAHHTRAGDHQHILDSLLPEKISQFPDFSRPLQIFGHSIAHAVIADFQNRLKAAAAKDLQRMGYRHRKSLLAKNSPSPAGKGTD